MSSDGNATHAADDHASSAGVHARYVNHTQAMEHRDVAENADHAASISVRDATTSESRTQAPGVASQASYAGGWAPRSKSDGKRVGALGVVRGSGEGSRSSRPFMRQTLASSHSAQQALPAEVTPWSP
ncbi:MAG: hypothetical protein AAGB29_00210 [Planctomycetota bacterium]